MPKFFYKTHTLRISGNGVTDSFTLIRGGEIVAEDALYDEQGPVIRVVVRYEEDDQ